MESGTSESAEISTPIVLKPSTNDWKLNYWLWSECETYVSRLREKHVSDEVCVRLWDRYEGGTNLTEAPLCSKEMYKLTTQLVIDFPTASRSGKWLLMGIGKDRIDEIWEKIKKNIEEGNLGPTAKVGSLGNDTFMICVYTDDFTDRNELTRVLNKLVDLKLVGERGITYKSDLITLFPGFGGFSSSMLNGTFYHGSATNGVTEPGHFNGNNGKGKQVVCKM
jgi:hypothetical protein